MDKDEGLDQKVKKKDIYSGIKNQLLAEIEVGSFGSSGGCEQLWDICVGIIVLLIAGSF